MRRLILRPHAVSEVQGAEQVKFVWVDEALSITLKGPFLRLAERFATAQGAQAVAESLGPQVEAQIAARAIERLVDAGVLIDSARAEWETSARTGLFGAPVLSAHAAVTGDADVIVVGVPYDAGTTYRPGTRFGPQAIRRASTAVFQLTEPPTGMYDPVREERVLQGVRIRDIGDVLPDVTRSQRRLSRVSPRRRERSEFSTSTPTTTTRDPLRRTRPACTMAISSTG